MKYKIETIVELGSKLWILKKFIKENRVLYKMALNVLDLYIKINAWINACNSFRRISRDKPHIFYLGIPAHNNLGDLAQGICIRKWISKHYPDYQVIEVETNALVNTPFSQIRKLKVHYRSEDLIIFQSGYTTTNLGGHADEMHRAVISALPTARMLMMPQTIYFQHEENKKEQKKYTIRLRICCFSLEIRYPTLWHLLCFQILRLSCIQIL